MRRLDHLNRTLVEGQLYKVVDGELEPVEPADPDDDRVRLKVSRQAGSALKHARHLVTRAMFYRPEIEDLADVIIRAHAEQAPAPDTIERWIDLLRKHHQAPGR